jgi:hypothetical protein
LIATGTAPESGSIAPLSCSRIARLEAIDRHDDIRDLHLVAQVGAHQAGDASFPGEHQRVAAAEGMAVPPSGMSMDPFGLHEQVVGGLGPAELAEAGAFDAGGSCQRVLPVNSCMMAASPAGYCSGG